MATQIRLAEEKVTSLSLAAAAVRNSSAPIKRGNSTPPASSSLPPMGVRSRSGLPWRNGEREKGLFLRGNHLAEHLDEIRLEVIVLSDLYIPWRTDAHLGWFDPSPALHSEGRLGCDHFLWTTAQVRTAAASESAAAVILRAFRVYVVYRVVSTHSTRRRRGGDIRPAQRAQIRSLHPSFISPRSRLACWLSWVE